MAIYLFCVVILLSSSCFNRASTQGTSNGTDFMTQIKLTDSTPTVLWNQTFKHVAQVVAEDGFKIVVTIEDCNMNVDKSEYVTVSTDADGANDVIKMTYTVSKRPSFLYNNNELFAKFVGSAPSSILLNFTRVGKRFVSTTTEIPTTTMDLPTPGPDVRNEFTINMTGWNFKDYEIDSNRYKIKMMLADIGNSFCNEHQYGLVDNVTTDNVIIRKIIECPATWPNYETCVRITFSLPVSIVENPDAHWTGYQFTTNNMIEMWEQFSTDYLPKGLSIYDLPDTDKWMQWQLYLFLVLMLVFILLIVLIRYYSTKLVQPIRRRKLSDTKSIISSKMDSINDLRPHPLQETPPLFENVRPMFDPVKTHMIKAHATFADDRPDVSTQKKDWDIEFADEEEEESGA